jgi:hypothetical protein
MIPVRNVGEFSQEGGRITLFIPRFRSQWMRKWLVPAKRSKHFRVHLDELGSKVWLMIDGERDTGEICNLMCHVLPGQEVSDDSNALRVTEFLRRLYKNRFIVFKS